MRKSTITKLVGIFLLGTAMLAVGLVSNTPKTASAVTPLSLSVYAPGSYSEVGDVMQRYMVRSNDLLSYQPRHEYKFVPDIISADGGFCISCATPDAGEKNLKEAIADAQKFDTDVIAYNFEHWTETPATEQSNPVGSMDTAAQLTHAAGLKFMFNPDGGYLWNKAPDGVQYYKKYNWNNAEYLLIQFQSDRYAGGAGVDGTNVADFKNKVQTVTSYVKSKNPDIKIFVQLSLSFNKPDILIKKTEALESLSTVNGVLYFYHENQSSCEYCTRSNLVTVLEALRPAL
jgi:hypothetical protein